MLVRTDFASWQQRPFQRGTVRETLAEGTEGVPHLGPERPRVYSDLTPEEKERYNVDIQATNILLQGLPKDIYSLINHYTDAKDIWDNVKMLVEGSELTKEDRKSQLVNKIEDWGTMHEVQVQLVMCELRTELGGQDNVVDEDVDEQPFQDLALNVDNVFQADDCDAFDSDVDEAPTVQTMIMVNLSSVDPVYDEVDPSYDSNILFEIHDQETVCKHHELHEMHDDAQPEYVVESYDDYTSDSNMILYDQYVKDNAVPIVQSNVSSVPNDAYMMILNDMHEQPAQHVSVTT
nr:hypothetical protein [Tanacetum cinerariifolium]